MKKFIKTAFAGLLLCLLLLAGSISVHAQIHFDRASVNVLNGSSTSCCNSFFLACLNSIGVKTLFFCH